MGIGRRILQGLYDILLNGVIASFPSWTVRKLFYQASGMKIEKGARIGIRTRIIKPRGIVIGARTVINSDCFLDGRGGLVIGEDVTISKYSKIITESHDKNSGSFATIDQMVEIKDRAWLGIAAMLLPGSFIDDNSIVGAGCVFKGRTEKNAIVVGNPAKRIGTRELEQEYQKHYIAFFN